MFGLNLIVFGTKLEGYTPQLLEAVKALGYDGVEPPAFSNNVDDYSAFGERARAAGLEVPSIVGIAGPGEDIGSANEFEAAAGLGLMVDRLRYAKAAGAKIASGPTLGVWGHRPEGIEPDALAAYFSARVPRIVDALIRLAGQCGKYGVKYLLEYITRWEMFGYNTIDEIVALLLQAESSQLGALIDSAHQTTDGHGWDSFGAGIGRLVEGGHPIQVHASPPHRRDLRHSCVDWTNFYGPLKRSGLVEWILYEAFNAAPPFFEGASLTSPPFMDVMSRERCFGTHAGRVGRSLTLSFWDHSHHSNTHSRFREASELSLSGCFFLYF
ncbi:hypothetical protein CMO96_01430 [Candidatus Woesebacteria bacterium]|nr:hypothetical protein [Candidatus Woesebacteria bacterium]